MTRPSARCSISILLLCGLGLLASSRSLASQWPHWRGPNYNGATDEKNLPTTFSKTQNVQWVAELPGPSAATPIVWDQTLFVSSAHQENQTLLAMALDRRSGKVLWKHEIGPGIRKDDRSNFASPSPVTDGKIVVFFFGNGELWAFDFAGQKLWSRNIQNDYGQFAFMWTFSASPTLHQGKLYLQVLQRSVPVGGRGRKDGPNDSYLLALNPADGHELWRHIRPSEAREESLEAFSTPLPFTIQGTSQLLVAGGDCLTGHDPATGRELWRWGTWNPSRIPHWRLVPSPVVGGPVALACAPKADPIYAVKLGLRGNLDDSALAWKSSQREVSSDVATPLFYQGHFYILNGERQAISKVDPAQGTVVWTGTLDRRPKIESSPVGADGKIYFMNFRGDVFVVEAGDSFKLLHVAEMGEPDDSQTRSSISIAHGQLFIRTNRKLFCVGQ